MWLLAIIFFASAARLCDAAVYGDAAYRSVLSTVPGITFVSTTPSMGDDDTSVYFSSFAWPANRTAQQQDYVSVPVAAMALCLAVQPSGAINVTTAPTMKDIGDVLLGRSTGASWLRSDWSSTTQQVSKVYWATSSTSPLLNALSTWYGAPYTSSTVAPAAMSSTAAIVPADADVVAALSSDPNAVAFVPLIVAVQAKMACLSITTPTPSGGTAVLGPQLDKATSSVITYTASSVIVTCPVGAGCYPLVGALVAHVRKSRSMTAACNTTTSLLRVIYSFTSTTSTIAAPLSRWSMLFPPSATQVATLQQLTTWTCMPETLVLGGVGGVLRVSALNDWFYEYYMETNGTVFLTYNATSSSYAQGAVSARTSDFASGSALTSSERSTYPMLHSYPSLATSVALIVNVGQDVTVMLPRCSITSIFNGTIQWWNDTAIQAVNPMSVMPQQRIDVTLRVESSPTTDIFMAGLRALDVECFGTTPIAATAVLPSITRASRFSGNVAVANHVATTPFSMTWSPYDYVKSNTYLNQAKIQADDGSVTTTADVQQALVGGTYDVVTSDYTLSAVNMGYPFVGISSFIVPLQAFGLCERSKATADFIIWTLTSSTALALAIAEQLQPMAADKFESMATCNGLLLYPQPPAPVLWWPIAAAGVVALFLSFSGWRGLYRWWVNAVRPTDPAKPIAIMFVGVKNQAAVTEAGEKNVAAVHKRVAETTRRIVRKHRCYEARRVDAWTTMIVAKTAQAAVACAEDLVLALYVDVQWADEVMTQRMPVPHPHTQRRSDRDRSSAASVPSAESGGGSSSHRQRDSHRSSRHTDTSRTGSQSRLTVLHCIPQIGAGVHWAHVMIDDSQEDVVSYYGAGVATAASVADMAVDGEVVVSRALFDELNVAAEDTKLADFLFNPVTTTAAEEATVLSLTTPRFPDWLLQRTAERRKSLEEKGADGGGNTIAAAMASADGALAKRRIAVVSLLMRDFISDRAEGRRDDVREALATLCAIVTTHRGEIHSITDGVVTVTIGASGPVAMAAVRAAQIATDAADLCIAAGVHSGRALVGNAMGSKPVTVGRIVTGAALMRQVALRSKVPIVASDVVYAELSSRFQLVTVDLIAAPWDLRKNIRCYGVVEERSENNDEGEWLYEMTDGFAPLERRLDECLRDISLPSSPTGLPSQTVLAAADQASAGRPSDATLARVFLERHHLYVALSNGLVESLRAAAQAGTASDVSVRHLITVTTFGIVSHTTSDASLD